MEGSRSVLRFLRPADFNMAIQSFAHDSHVPLDVSNDRRQLPENAAKKTAYGQHCEEHHHQRRVYVHWIYGIHVETLGGVVNLVGQQSKARLRLQLEAR
jgi:hypothetical protein